MRMGLSIVAICFSSLGEALQPDYNSVANVVKKGRIPPTVLNLRELPVGNETTVWAEIAICVLLTSFGFRFLIGSLGLQFAQ
jgi:hypothetical protein